MSLMYVIYTSFLAPAPNKTLFVLGIFVIFVIDLNPTGWYIF